MIWYSHVNEDSAVEHEIALDGEHTRVFCIVGSGERLIALLGSPTLTQIHAIDTNPEALYLLALKLAALRSLSADDYMRFIGLEFDDPELRARRWRELRPALQQDAQRYWDRRERWIRMGIVNCGHFERFLSTARPFLNAFLGKGFAECWTLEPGQFRHFPWRRWSVVKHILSWRIAFLLAGNRDPAFVSSGANVSTIAHGLQRMLDQNLVSESFIWHLIFKGHLRDMDPSARPLSLQPRLLEDARQALLTGRTVVRVHAGDLLEVLRTVEHGRFQNALFSLSDLLSFCDFAYLRQVLDVLAGSRSTVVVRSFLKNDLSAEQIQVLRSQRIDVTDWSDRERTCMYRVHALSV